MNRPLWVLIAAAGLLVGAPSAKAEDALPLESKYRARPESGIHIDNIDRDADPELAWLKIRVVSDTAVKDTWEVVGNIEDWDQAMDLISRVQILGEEFGEIRYRLFVSPPWPLNDFDSIVRIRRTGKPHHFSYWVERGFMQGSSGAISVGNEPGQGSWILFENYGSPASRFPDWMVKIGIHLVLPSVLKDIHKRIREVASQASDSG